MNLNYIFWEKFSAEHYQIVEHQYIEKEFQKISFYRDDNYKIICKLEGDVECNESVSDLLAEKNNLNKGELINTGKPIKAEKDYIFKAEIEGLRIKNKKEYLYPIDNQKITAEGELNCLTTYYETNEQPDYIKFWFLNNEEYTKFFYNIATCISGKNETDIELKGLKKYKVKRLLDRFTYINSISLKINNKQFIFGYVEKKYTNDVPGSYLMFTKNNFPDEDELLSIQNTLSFIIGKMFILIGFTTYNTAWSPLKNCYFSSNLDDVKHIISINRMPSIPVDLENVIKYNIYFPKTINKLLKNYHKYRNIISLDKIMFYINTSRHLSLSIKMQPLAAALDLFQEGWFKSKYSKSHGKHLHDEKYAKIISTYIDSITKDLGKNKKTTPPIINRIKTCNNISIRERHEVMFREIGLPIGKIEQSALKGRNVVVHGALKSKDYEEMLILTRAYYSLLNRLMLKILKYDGFYIDYSTFGYPCRKINEPLGGPKGNGII